MPWRQTRDPYAIWVSEAMCQQTQIATVLPYYARWMERFPTLAELAATPEAEVLAHWQGLGYYRRARLLHEGAQTVVRAGLPQSADGWRKVPGVGAYTAAAIASIASREAVAVADGNVHRVYARFTGTEGYGSSWKRRAADWAQSIIDPEHPGDWNQAMMELGALVCRPRNPDCGACPLAADCMANRTRRQSELPTPEPRRAPVALHRVLVVQEHAGCIAWRRAGLGEWWSGMWVLPSFETVEDAASSLGLEAKQAEGLGTIRFTVTHHRVEAQVLRVRVTDSGSGYEWMSRADEAGLAIPSPHRRALQLLPQLDST